MPKTTIRYTHPMNIRLEAEMMRRIRAGVKRLRPRVSVSEWVRDVLREAAESLPKANGGNASE